MSSYRNEVIQDAIRFADTCESRFTPELMADFFLNHPITKASEHLRETVGMWCAKCPVEVQRALHSMPDIEKHHFRHPFFEPENNANR